MAEGNSLDKKIRVAFLTPEFVTEYSTGGGLGNYLDRMTRALRECGHETDVFVLSESKPGVVNHGEVRVHRVARTYTGLRRCGQLISRLKGLRKYRMAIDILAGAASLKEAMEAEHLRQPFDVVQSSDYQAAGWYVNNTPRRPHLVRCSNAGDLYAAIDRDEHTSQINRWWQYFEMESVRRAPIAYAPSKYVAGHLESVLGRKVNVLRPAWLPYAGEREHVPGLPPKYLVHFGQIRRRKGTHLIAEALPIAWEQAVDLQIVFVGRPYGNIREEWSRKWGAKCENVKWLGEMKKPSLYTVVEGALAAVLPSIVDNLPNTVIESLHLGIPVIGTAGASIDELVEHEVTGELVECGNVKELAEAMVRVWEGKSKVRRGFRWKSHIAQEMNPVRAVTSFLWLAGIRGEPLESAVEETSRCESK